MICNPLHPARRKHLGPRLAGQRAIGRNGDRQAFTLLEVIVALAILVGAVAILGELARFSLKNARAAKDLSRAQLLAESKMSELIAGVVPLEGNADVAFDDLPSATDWRYTVEVGESDITNLMAVTLTVKPAENANVANTFTLSRLVVDPTSKQVAATTSSTSSGSSSSGSGSTSGSTSGGTSGSSSGGSSGSSSGTSAK